MNKISVGNRKITPSKIVCVGRNYVAHIEELNNEIPQEIVFFLKPNSALSEELHSFHQVPFHQEPLHYEAELCFLYEDGRFSAVGLGLDITKRALQSQLKEKGLPWERAKAFDGSAVFSPFVEIPSISENLQLELAINKKIIQSGSIHLMIHKPDEIVSELLTFMSLNEGDVVMTGTPKGVGVINKDDVFVGRVMDGGEVMTRVEWVAK